MPGSPDPRITPDTSTPAADAKRRRFLFALGASGAGAAAAAAAPAVGAVAAQASAAPASGASYRETEHVRDYYDSARL
ncbi:MAG TPA: hypothetical protein VMV45_03350 [Casimicrobiaceae bacterium]|nr:hypothetical protein [Casimicrobiaceae bacterium]